MEGTKEAEEEVNAEFLPPLSLLFHMDFSCSAFENNVYKVEGLNRELYRFSFIMTTNSTRYTHIILFEKQLSGLHTKLSNILM